MEFQRIAPSALIESSLSPHVLDQLCTASNTKKDVFQQRYMPLLLRLAEYIQELPLSKSSYSERGGALRFAVVSSLLTLRMADSVIFVTSGSERRKLLDPQYRFAAFAASIATVPLLVHYNIAIEIDNAEWSYLFEEPNLYQRLPHLGGYRVSWKAPNTKIPSAISILILGGFFGTGRWKDFDADVLKDFCEAINPSGALSAIESPMAKIVRLGHEKARSIEEKSTAQVYRPPESSNSVEATVGMLSAVAMVPIPAVVLELAKPAIVEQDIELPTVVKGWIKYVRENKTIFASIRRNPSGNLLVPAAAFAGIGMPSRDLVEILKKDHLVINTAAGWATLNSKMTTLIDPDAAISDGEK